MKRRLKEPFGKASLTVALLALTASSAFAAGDANQAAAAEACPNEAFRTGKSALLPDCRAYELITPASNTKVYLGETPSTEKSRNLFPTEEISSPGTSAIFYAVNGILAEPAGGHGKHDGYQAVRTPVGWRTVRLMNPTSVAARRINAGGSSADHRYGFFEVGTFGSEPYPLELQGNGSYLGKPDGTFELLGVGSLGEQRQAVGNYISPDGSHIIFSTHQPSPQCASHCELIPLEPDAPPAGTTAIYDRGPDGPTNVVSLLPGNVTPAAGKEAVYQGAAADASAVAFTIENVMYARIDGTKTEQVVDAGPGPTPTFGGISADGSRIFYMLGENPNVGDIYAFDTASDSTEPVATTGDAELVNVSADGSHVYFLSREAIAGTPAIAGQPNLYLWTQAGGTAFVATLDPGDVSGPNSLTNWTMGFPQNPAYEAGSVGPGSDPSRTTPDGSALVFESVAELTAYPSGGHQEIYRYEAASGTISCVSCNPQGTAAGFDARLEAVEGEVGENEEPAIDPQSVVYNLSTDGTRVFFESAEALTRKDVDAINDVYEWTDAGGVPRLSLISSGRTPNYLGGIPGFLEFSEPTNVILGITPSGNDVMFGSSEALVEGGSPEGVQVIYDARVGGGFAEPLNEPCSGGACQASASPPNLDAPRSDGFHGHGNFRQKKRCTARGSGGKRRRHDCRRHRNRGHHGHRRTAHRGATKTGGAK